MLGTTTASPSRARRPTTSRRCVPCSTATRASTSSCGYRVDVDRASRPCRRTRGSGATSTAPSWSRPATPGPTSCRPRRRPMPSRRSPSHVLTDRHSAGVDRRARSRPCSRCGSDSRRSSGPARSIRPVQPFLALDDEPPRRPGPAGPSGDDGRARPALPGVRRRCSARRSGSTRRPRVAMAIAPGWRS